MGTFYSQYFVACDNSYYIYLIYFIYFISFKAQEDCWNQSEMRGLKCSWRLSNKNDSCIFFFPAFSLLDTSKQLKSHTFHKLPQDFLSSLVVGAAFAPLARRVQRVVFIYLFFLVGKFTISYAC